MFAAPVIAISSPNTHACQLAQMQTNAFRQLLKQRNIPLYSYEIEDFELDLKNLREFARL
ncbi:MAG: UPF0175 family protein [Cyanomargarita calcarea GSE-NOS-MK-12-04C]|jgi:predicted HTH domain antitoxin|uniref:UPF0175 family protein n=1 Tax=Cyanomargarita calcarea GSE-NOS-MK-12-04C TaxID=2839659 RepID=A0A951UUM7_9CYAN|nr:UPF0175 family protein [Cyanomargarita calcarea GSE-NOS-MK-12-04C]